ncbi:MAG: hypothetical protein GY803_32040 [Chloroflexi bacterium]|nr:hypothetical protein [Chloroflexota bacterium]
MAITGSELHKMGIPAALEQIRARIGDGRAYLTFDIDFVDPAFAPGTGMPEVGGFTGAQSLQLLRGLVGLNFIGYDVVEVMPSYDPANITSLLAANLAYEFISLAAIQKKQKALADFDQLTARMKTQNAAFDDDKVNADVAAALEETRRQSH